MTTLTPTPTALNMGTAPAPMTMDTATRSGTGIRRTLRTGQVTTTAIPTTCTATSRPRTRLPSCRC